MSQMQVSEADVKDMTLEQEAWEMWLRIGCVPVAYLESVLDKGFSTAKAPEIHITEIQ